MRISFIVPFHNEERNVSPMLDKLLNLIEKNKWEAEVIAVNDKSSDETEEILHEYAKRNSLVRVINRRRGREKAGNTMGKALREGTKEARGEIVIWTMGDRSDDPTTYARIVKQLRNGYQMVFASRYMKGGSKGNLDSLKAFLSRWGTILARIMFDIPVHDITNAFRGFKKEVFIKADPCADDFAISPEFAIRAYLQGFKLGEVPTTYHNRVEGVSSFKLFKMTRSYLTTYLNLFIRYKILGKSFRP